MTEAEASAETATAPLDRIKDLLHTRWVQVLLGVGVVGLLLLMVTYGKFNSIRHEGIDKETALTAQYLDNQNELSTFISTFYEQLGIADHKSDKLNAILTDAVKGRYDNTGLTPATPGQTQGNQLISAIVEAYPDLSGLNTYDTVLNTISSGRQAYKAKQSKLLDMLRSYDKWRKQDIIGSALISLGGFPSSNLRAQIGTDSVTGSAAEAKMYEIVLASQATQAYTTGTLEPLTIPSSSKEN